MLLCRQAATPVCLGEGREKATIEWLVFKRVGMKVLFQTTRTDDWSDQADPDTDADADSATCALRRHAWKTEKSCPSTSDT